MTIDGPHHLITYSETGQTEPRQLLRPEELAFSVRMALRKSSFGGTPRAQRPAVLSSLEQAVVEHFRLCDYQVFCIIPQPVPMIVGPRRGEDTTPPPVTGEEST